VGSPGEKTREWICMIDGSKRVKSSNDGPFGGFGQKIFTPTSIGPKILKVLHYKSCCVSLKTRINLGGSATKIYSNREQPIGVSNLRLKICLEVEFRTFLHMHNRKMAKNT